VAAALVVLIHLEVMAVLAAAVLAGIKPHQDSPLQVAPQLQLLLALGVRLSVLIMVTPVMILFFLPLQV
jgi:hypothetical protein